MTSSILNRVAPFVNGFRGYDSNRLRHDLIAGVTVALVLIPQSMAYAQLAGLPPYYGLYAAFIPPIIAALFGSSRQLATGPVAIVSLMTATALEPIATAGSESFIAYAILLALLIGIFQLLLGVLRLGLVVNFLSHPVVSGFTNAGALIIATSQLSKLFGVTVDQAEHHYETIYRVIEEAIYYTHWPTLALAALAFAIMIGVRRVAPRLPNVLLAVLITTLVSYFMGFEDKIRIPIERVESTEFTQHLAKFNSAISYLEEKATQRVTLRGRYDSLAAQDGVEQYTLLDLNQKLEYVGVDIDRLKKEIHQERTWLRRYHLTGVTGQDGEVRYFPKDSAPKGDVSDNHCWRIKVGNVPLNPDELTFSCGGAVVGKIPEGLPSFKIPSFDFSVALGLLPMAMIISLLGFMEAISIAKAMAAKTGQRLDANQELIGQGLANIIGSFSRSYAVSGSFSRSAVNLQSGAITGMSNVTSSLVVLVVLLFLTPLLYHLPQSVLAAIIMMAVVGLLNVKSFIHAWRAQWYDGMIGIVTFIFTLTFAPHLDRGIIIGVALSLLLYLIRNMKPAMAMLSLNIDGSYRNRERFSLEQCPYVAVLRYGGSLIFSNVDYLENQVLDTVRNMPKLRHLIIVGNGINEIDASGVDALSVLVDRLHGQGLQLSISGCNDSVLDVLKRTGLAAKIGENNIYRSVARAIDGVWEKAHVNVDEANCPLRVPPFHPLGISDESRRAMMEADKQHHRDLIPPWKKRKDQ
ncbi:MAG TPA: SulP family inorganic anion transporter [candidate division Zixibacteria bacterium]|nr:SulP family inorganic anion transporter [candidate division Zixibacteria bacterium]